jgi:hypothetical protein
MIEPVRKAYKSSLKISHDWAMRPNREGCIGGQDRSRKLTINLALYISTYNVQIHYPRLSDKRGGFCRAPF